MFYQKVNTEELINSTESKQMSNCNQTFDCLDLRKFEAESIGDITVYNFFDVGQTFSKTCLLDDAMFYKMCRNSFGNQHFQTARKKTDNSAETPTQSSESCGKTTRSSFCSSNFQSTCIFCDGIGGCLRNVSSFVIDKPGGQVAVLLGDDELVAKLSEGDMPAIETKHIPATFANFTAEL